MALSTQPAALRAGFLHSVIAAHIGLLGMVILWGASWPAGKILVQELPPLTAAAFRFVLTCTVLIPWWIGTGRAAALRAWNRRRWLGMFSAGAVGVFGYAVLFLMGLQYLPASQATLLVTITPVITMLAGVWLFGEKVNRLIIFGMVLAVSGAVVVISRGEPLRLLQGTALGLGEWLILGCVLCWVAYTLIGRQVLIGVDALTTTTVTSVVGTVLLLLAALLVEGERGWLALRHAGAQTWGAAVFLGWGATAVAYGWYFNGIRALGAGAASGYITLVPVAGVLAAALWLGETLGLYLLGGGVMAVVGTAIMAWGRRPGGER